MVARAQFGPGLWHDLHQTYGALSRPCALFFTTLDVHHCTYPMLRLASLAKTAKGRRGSLLAGCVGGDIRLAKSDGLSLRQSQGSFSHGRRGAPDFGVIIGCPESVSDLCPNPDVLATSRNSYDELRILQRGRHCTCNQLSGVAGSAAAICLLLRIQSENRRITAAP